MFLVSRHVRSCGCILSSTINNFWESFRIAAFKSRPNKATTAEETLRGNAPELFARLLGGCACTRGLRGLFRVVDGRGDGSVVAELWLCKTVQAAVRFSLLPTSNRLITRPQQQQQDRHQAITTWGVHADNGACIFCACAVARSWCPICVWRISHRGRLHSMCIYS